MAILRYLPSAICYLPSAICHLLSAIRHSLSAIYLDSRGPILYRQARVGKGGRIFYVYKFRSMVPDAEKGRAVWAQEDDPRVTRLGRILRRTHVDEFPQFLNILKGEMSAAFCAGELGCGGAEES